MNEKQDSLEVIFLSGFCEMLFVLQWILCEWVPSGLLEVQDIN